MLAQILKIIGIVSAVLSGLSASTNIDVTHIAPILAKITALLSSLATLQSPTSIDADIADLTALLTSLGSSGLVSDSGPINDALAAIAKFQAVEHDYETGQAALITNNFSYAGMPGDLVALKRGGPAAATLGL